MKIPTILADNAGYDSSELVSRLRAAHYDGKSETGLDMINGSIGSMRELGVTESFKLKRQVVSSATEAAEMILRCVFHFGFVTERSGLTCHMFEGWTRY